MEEAERRYMASGLVAHRKSLAYTGRDLSKQVTANLVGSPDLIREKVADLAVTHEGRYYACRNIEMFPKPKQNPFALWIGGHNLEAVERALRFGTGWLPGWRPWPELEERIR